ncbi:MAG: metal-sensing transcriptional repressor [Alphaproteobacteria bacterium]|nr:metal-sensing transcriptional repressor [Alphaproteobacteria bacterium]MBU0797636.1 metal-sensing transcriptional repressor [Alphaproteobacteria bacterium]MBU0887510.1 metal-sensing transcriptional repressor [Alphaproteobacteria bacterium]MBU1814747.1 metal-sensing transcriptional repressor [Alphaproteobacteria bacterium]
MTDHAPHHHHDDILKRLRRAEGHLRSVLAMMEDGRSCVVLAQQLHAVERAISEAKRVLIRDHIDHCLDSAVAGDAQDHLAEFKEITRYL